MFGQDVVSKVIQCSMLCLLFIQGPRGEKRPREDQGLFDGMDEAGDMNRFQKQRRHIKSKSNNKKKGRR